MIVFFIVFENVRSKIKTIMILPNSSIGNG